MLIYYSVNNWVIFLYVDFVNHIYDKLLLVSSMQ